MIFTAYLFTNCVRNPAPFGDSIFRCTTKDRGERRAKGVATPFHPPGVNVDSKPDVLCAYFSATTFPTRLSRLRCREANTLGVRFAYPLASACCTAKGTVMLTILLGTAVSMSPWKQCACHTPRTGLIASIAQRRAPKEVPLGDQRGSQPPLHAFLHYLSSCNERWCHRRSPEK